MRFSSTCGYDETSASSVIVDMIAIKKKTLLQCAIVDDGVLSLNAHGFFGATAKLQAYISASHVHQAARLRTSFSTH
jgi:hypothetical protein